ncbi:MAG: CMP/dCMP kinase [Patescibacteria group bacterium]|nr:CMP/dCMP kinase [Patescibacteria group bacterium]
MHLNTHNNSTTNEINIIPIIAIDGTTASGKGTIARRLAKHYSYNYLNSGALYRLAAYILQKQNFDFERYNTLRKQEQFETEEYKAMEQQVINAGANLSPIFLDKQVLVDGTDIWTAISTQEYGNYAARISPTKDLRVAIHDFQRSCIKLPGLVAEGRDMTGVVFVDAICKIYMDGTAEERAKRRLIDEQKEISGCNKTLENVLSEVIERDEKDKNRFSGALTLTEDSYYLDTTNKSIEEVLEEAILYCNSKLQPNN